MITLLSILNIAFAIGFMITQYYNSKQRNKLIAMEADLNAWKASCGVLQAEINRYEEYTKGIKGSAPPLKPIPISQSSTDRWRKVTLE